MLAKILVDTCAICIARLHAAENANAEWEERQNLVKNLL